jgi:hypothetical protein
MQRWFGFIATPKTGIDIHGQKNAVQQLFFSDQNINALIVAAREKGYGVVSHRNLEPIMNRTIALNQPTIPWGGDVQQYLTLCNDYVKKLDSVVLEELGQRFKVGKAAEQNYLRFLKNPMADMPSTELPASLPGEKQKWEPSTNPYYDVIGKPLHEIIDWAKKRKN